MCSELQSFHYIVRHLRRRLVSRLWVSSRMFSVPTMPSEAYLSKMNWANHLSHNQGRFEFWPQISPLYSQTKPDKAGKCLQSLEEVDLACGHNSPGSFAGLLDRRGCVVDQCTADERFQNFRIPDSDGINGKDVVAEHHHVGEFALSD
jgi:hypothetical protein